MSPKFVEWRSEGKEGSVKGAQQFRIAIDL